METKRKLVWPFPKNSYISSKWDEPRPLSNPGKHPHGAIDIKAIIGAVIVAPEAGELFLYASIRSNNREQWPDDGSNHFPFKNYFYDVYGGLIVLKGKSGLTHVFAHSYLNQIHNKKKHDWVSIEEKANKRFPVMALLAGGIRVKAGEKIGEVGNAGYSTGPHCHYEIHEGFQWTKWEDRPDPEKLDWLDISI